jgi:hypothetical protein
MSITTGLLQGRVHLRELELRELADLTDSDLATVLRDAQHLQILKVITCPQISWHSISDIGPSVPALRELHLVVSDLIVDVAWSAWPQLRELHLGADTMADQTLQIQLSLVPQLQHLAIRLPQPLSAYDARHHRSIGTSPTELYSTLMAGGLPQLRRFDFLSSRADLGPVQAALQGCPKLQAVGLPRVMAGHLSTVRADLVRTGVGVLFRDKL